MKVYLGKYVYSITTYDIASKIIFWDNTKYRKKVNSILKGKIPLIGVGGVSNPVSAREKLENGATLVQLYSSLVYRGPAVIKNIVNNI